MQVHEIKLRPKRENRKRVGRGGKRGTYSGRGMKGQKSRSGAKIDPLFEGGRSSLIERLKKMPGFKSPRLKRTSVNLGDLDKKFKNGETVSVENLIKTGLISRKEAKQRVKILGKGKLTKKLAVEKNILLSKSAEKEIQKAGKQPSASGHKRK